MNTPRLETLTQAWCDDQLSDAQAAELNEILRVSPRALEHFREAAQFHGLLHCAASKWVVRGISGQLAQGTLPSRPGAFRAWFKWRTVAAAAAGVALALLGTPRGFGEKSSRVLSHCALLPESLQAEAKPAPLPGGFPQKFGMWSGDDSALVPNPLLSGQPRPKYALLFKKAEREKALPANTPSACDVFYLVDMRPLKPAIGQGEATLELSAKFLDARARAGEPVIFVTRLYTYAGQPDSIAEDWPLHSRQEALSYASNQFETRGGSPSSTRTLRSVVTLHPQTDFAVVHLIAFKPESGAAAAAGFGEQYALEVQCNTRVPNAPSERFTQSKPQPLRIP